MKIPFDIKFRAQIDSGEYKVETRDGRTARIICWDRKRNSYPIIALLDGDSLLLSYTQNGQHVKGISNVQSDLFIVTPEPELTEFENELATVIGFAISQSVSSPEEKMMDFVKNWSERLLALARKQLQPEIDEAYKTADEVMYRKGKEDGIAEARNDITARIIALKQAKDRAEEALKNLPRWKKCPLYFEHGEIGKTNKDEDVLSYKGYRILLSDLEKLPKEDNYE